MIMNIWIELGGIINIIILISILSYAIYKETIVTDFFKKYISPNFVSYLRLWFGWFDIVYYNYGVHIQSTDMVYVAVWFFTFLAMTDLLDGIVARACGLKSSKGAILDAFADKGFYIPALLMFSYFPSYEPMYLLLSFGILTFDIIGQYIRGKYSPPEAGIYGKIKTTIIFITIYAMIMNGRYPDIYNTYQLEIIIPILLSFSLFFAGISMMMKTKWYNIDFKKWYNGYLKVYLKEYIL